MQKVGKNKLFFDKRDNSNFDLLTVSETANEPPQVSSALNALQTLLNAAYLLVFVMICYSGDGSLLGKFVMIFNWDCGDLLLSKS